MTLKRGSSKKILAENIVEFHRGKRYAKTARKFGKKTADDQAVAAAFSERRASQPRKKSKSFWKNGIF